MGLRHGKSNGTSSRWRTTCRYRAPSFGSIDHVPGTICTLEYDRAAHDERLLAPNCKGRRKYVGSKGREKRHRTSKQCRRASPLVRDVQGHVRNARQRAPSTFPYCTLQHEGTEAYDEPLLHLTRTYAYGRVLTTNEKETKVRQWALITAMRRNKTTDSSAASF